MSDNRREPDDEPRKPSSEVITGVRRRDVVKRLDALTPTPSRPPADEPGSVIAYIERWGVIHREDQAYGIARTEEALIEVKDDLANVKVHVMKLGGKVERLEDRINAVANTQLAQNSELISLRTSLGKMEETFTGAISNMHARVNVVEDNQRRDRKRMDDFEKSFAQFRELIMRDVHIRERQLELEEAKNGTTSPPPANYDPRDASGPPTPKRK